MENHTQFNQTALANPVDSSVALTTHRPGPVDGSLLSWPQECIDDRSYGSRLAEMAVVGSNSDSGGQNTEQGPPAEDPSREQSDRAWHLWQKYIGRRVVRLSPPLRRQPLAVQPLLSPDSDLSLSFIGAWTQDSTRTPTKAKC